MRASDGLPEHAIAARITAAILGLRTFGVAPLRISLCAAHDQALCDWFRAYSRDDRGPASAEGGQFRGVAMRVNRTESSYVVGRVGDIMTIRPI